MLALIGGIYQREEFPLGGQGIDLCSVFLVCCPCRPSILMLLCQTSDLNLETHSPPHDTDGGKDSLLFAFRV
jgi:hypothetical protein